MTQRPRVDFFWIMLFMICVASTLTIGAAMLTYVDARLEQCVK